MEKDTLIFDIRGDYAHYRIPETTRSSISFPFPPGTALFGMIAGILGYERSTFWKDFQDLTFGLKILSDENHMGLMTSYVQTKFSEKFGEKFGSLSVGIVLPSEPYHPENRGFSSPLRLDYIVKPHYRVFLCGPDSILDNLEEKIQQHKFAYPPYLGHVNLFAELEFISREMLGVSMETSGRTSCTIPMRYVNLESSPGLLRSPIQVYYNMPMKMKVTKTKLDKTLKDLPQLKNRNYTEVPSFHQTIAVPLSKASNIPLQLQSNCYALNYKNQIIIPWFQ